MKGRNVACRVNVLWKAEYAEDPGCVLVAAHPATATDFEKRWVSHHGKPKNVRPGSELNLYTGPFRTWLLGFYVLVFTKY